MRWTTEKPSEPGYYWIAEANEQLHIVQIGIVSNSHNMMYVLLPGDNEKYLLGVWEGALWMGPLPIPA
jgi:hypothetical protein